MLTFEEKRKIIETFPELEAHQVSLGRINFHFDESIEEKKIVVYHLHPSGNGFVYTKNLSQYKSDDKGFTNIRDFEEDELFEIVRQSIYSLTDAFKLEHRVEETWVNEEGFELELIEEDDLWNVYSDTLLDGTFFSYKQATSYLNEEGFTKQ